MRRLLPLLALCGCATVQDAIDEKAYGESETYACTEEQAWHIARRVFRWEGADAIEDDRPEHMMVTSTGGDTGTVMVAWIEPVDPEHTKVTVVTKRRYQLSLFTALTETTFQIRFRQAAEMLKSGPLPTKAPLYR
jgi:hypothetical protein